MRRPRLPEPLRWQHEWTAPVSLLLLATGVAIVVVLHGLRPDVHPALHYVSEYGNERWSWLLTGALLLIGAGLVALASSIRATVRARTGPRLMQASGLLLILAALFSTDRRGGEVEIGTLAGKLHGVTAIAAFCLLVAAMAALSPRLEGDGAQLGRVSTLALPLALTGPLVAAAAFAVMPEAHGLRQRVFLVVVFGWLLATAVQVRAARCDDRRPG